MDQRKPQSAAKAVSLLFIINLISLPLGFAREMIMAAIFGTDIQMDAYYMAYGLMGILPIFLISYISATYVPEYVIARNESEEEASRFYSQILTFAVIASVFIAVLSCIFAPFITDLFASGFEGEVRELTIQILRIIVWIIPVTVVTYVWSSTLNARKSHIIPVIAGASVNLFVIPATLLLSRFFGIWAVVVALILNTIFQGMVLYLSVKQQGLRFHAIISVKDSRFRKTVRLAVPTAAMSATNQVNELVGRTISTSLPLGTVSALGYGVRLVNFIPGILFGSFMGVFLSRMSERAANNDKDGAIDIMWRTAEILLAVAIPVCVISAVMNNEIVRIAFERGAFSNESTHLVGLVLMSYIWVIIVYSVSQPLIYTLLAWQNMRGMIFRSVIQVVIVTFVSIVAAQYLGVIGIALGTLAGQIIYALLLVVTLRSLWGSLKMLRMLKEVIKMIVCAVACGVLALVMCGALPASNGTVVMDLFRFGSVTVICLGLFYGLAMLLRIRSVREVYRLVMGKTKSMLRRQID